VKIDALQVIKGLRTS